MGVLVEWDWSRLSTLTGDAKMIPRLIDEIFSERPQERSSAHGSLYCEVVNQGSLYSAAAGVADVILAELERRGDLSAEAWYLLDAMFRGTSHGRTVFMDGGELKIDDYCRIRIMGMLPLIEDAATGAMGEEFQGIVFLLGGMAEFCPAVSEILEREIAASTGERKIIAEGGLSEALELINESS
ncbi:hypothetical protein ACQP2T_20665 [Nonomuraea sp. CA-143628]|uniref:hypothetical protein n=1 Tax=Nonomuraea sp. CA-143628 TaxID=3239997 RepID=UPI003D8B4971